MPTVLYRGVLLHQVRVVFPKSQHCLPIVQSNYACTWPERLTLFRYNCSNWIFPLLIFVGGAVSTFVNRKKPVVAPDVNEKIAHLGLNRVGGGVLIVAWAVIWAVIVSLVSTNDYESNKSLHWFEAFYRTGSIIFGGGQVVLPLLLKDVTDVTTVCVDVAGAVVAAGVAGATCVTTETTKSWITEEQFFAGLAIVQAMPGPLFNLSAYIGAIAARRAGTNVAAGIASAWLGLFGPGVMLIYGILPFWGAFRSQPAYRRYGLGAFPNLASTFKGLKGNMVTFTGILAALTSTSQTHCLRNTVHPYQDSPTDPFLSQSQGVTRPQRKRRRPGRRRRVPDVVQTKGDFADAGRLRGDRHRRVLRYALRGSAVLEKRGRRFGRGGEGIHARAVENARATRDRVWGRARINRLGRGVHVTHTFSC